MTAANALIPGEDHLVALRQAVSVAVFLAHDLDVPQFIDALSRTLAELDWTIASVRGGGGADPFFSGLDLQ